MVEMNVDLLCVCLFCHALSASCEREADAHL